MRSLSYTIKQAFRQVFRNSAMSLASVFSITAMLLILGIFFILLINVNVLTESVKADYDTIEVFMLDEATEDDANAIINEIKTDSGVTDATYRTREEALKILKERWGDQAYLLDNLSKNPLPNSVVIKIDSLESAQAVADHAKQFEKVEQVNYYKDTVDKIMKVTNFIQLAAIILMVFLVVVSVVVVSNTIKLTVLARGDEIVIMKYIGATNWFVRGPFLVEGIIIGIVSSAVATGLIYLIYYKLVDLIGNDMMLMLSTPMVPVRFLVANTAIIFVALGASIGAVGSIISMRRFLNV